MDFSYHIEQRPGVNLVYLSGTLVDKAQAAKLLEEVESLIMAQKPKFVISLSKSQYINSTGLNVLINILTKARKGGGDAVVCSVPPKINELLLVTKLNTVFMVSASEEEALTRF